jgi:hypothetical protein
VYFREFTFITEKVRENDAMHNNCGTYPVVLEIW